MVFPRPSPGTPALNPLSKTRDNLPKLGSRSTPRPSWCNLCGKIRIGMHGALRSPPSGLGVVFGCFARLPGCSLGANIVKNGTDRGFEKIHPPFGVASGFWAESRLGCFGRFWPSGRVLWGRCPILVTKSIEKHVFYCVKRVFERFWQNCFILLHPHALLRFEGVKKLHFGPPNGPFWSLRCRPNARKYCK